MPSAMRAERNLSDELLLPGGEAAAGFAVQAHEPPAGVAGAQHGTQLVAKAQWLKQVTVTGTGLEVTVGHTRERADSPRVLGKFRPLIDVVTRELVVDEVGDHPVRDAFAKCLSEQQRGRVTRRPPQRVDRHHPPQPGQHLGLEAVGGVPLVAHGKDRCHDIGCGGSTGHGPLSVGQL